MTSKPHPKIDRESLKWDASIIRKEIFMYWKQKGIAGWYLGTLIAYDEPTMKHEIKWADGRAENWRGDLLACRKVKEWRCVQIGEDKTEFFK